MRSLPILVLLLAWLPSVGQEQYEVFPTDIRPAAEDFAPVRWKNAVVFCSLREQDGIIDHRDARTGKPLADLYRVELDDLGHGKAELLSEAITSPVNDGPASFNADGDLVCYTRNRTIPKRLGNMNARMDHLGLFFSRLENGAWSAPEPFEHNSDRYSVMHASLSADGMELVFASDMPGGQGGTDLYRSSLRNGSWTEPENLGPTINGPSNEVFPFLHPDGTLYFSSDRPGGAGRLDVLKADASGGAPVFMPPPVNSAGNDLGFTTDAQHLHGLMSSDRDGLDRILRVRRSLAPFKDCPEQVMDNFCYAFKEEQDLLDPSLPLAYRWDLGDGTVIQGPEAHHCYEAPGTYTAQLDVIDTETGELFLTQGTRTVQVERQRQAFILAPDTVRTGRAVDLDAGSSNLTDTDVDHYRWDLGDGGRSEGSVIRHAFRTPGIYTLKLEAVGRPGPDGRLEARCSSRRIVVMDRYKEEEDGVVVVTYQDARGLVRSFAYQELPQDEYALTEEELQDAQFTVELFASTERVALSDPRFLEIRKHYPILERFDPVRGKYTYSVGEAKDLAEMYAIYRKVKELQFMEAEVMMIHPEKLTDMSDLAFLTAQDLNRSLVRASNILFGYRDTTVMDAYLPTLDTIITTLNNFPELELVIEAHTDDVGGDDYNLALSQGRASSVEAHLLEKGIAATRIRGIGFGEQHPIANNSEAEGRRLNRRVEFRFHVKREEQANAAHD